MSLVGITLTGCVVGVWNFLPLGADPFTVFVNGFATTFHSSYGVWFYIITGLLLVFVFFANKKYIGVGTVFNLLCIGGIADGVNNLLHSWVSAELPLGAALAVMALNLVVLCFASSLYITSNLGVSAYDAMALMLADRHWFSFRVARVITDGLCVVIGILLGADIGTATILTAFFMGPLIQFFNRHVSEKLLKVT